MLYKTCAKCKKKLKLKETCLCNKSRHKIYDKFNRNKDAKEFYHSKEWIKVRKMVLERFNYLDVYELNTTGRIVPAEIVHHIVPLEESKKRSLDVDNLIPVSTANHNRIHRIYDKSGNDKKALQIKLKKWVGGR
ncbi:endonuclease [Streptobacillus canis]|uniref:endonuclease n=1 Tax=Streptobacillus canis TaxID=2678686 RepID=UPI0012E2A855|nr:endonuclease [Streptobacillus canis]